MSLSKKILVNTGIQTFGKVFTTVLGVVAFGMMTRYLDTAGFGAYTTITAFLQFFAIMADCGLSIVAIQLLAEPGEKEKKFAVAFTMRVVIIATLTVIAPLVSLLFPYPGHIKIGIALMALSFLFSSLIQMGRVIYQVHLRMDIPLLSDVISYLILIAGVWGVVHYDLGLNGIIGVITLNNLVQFLVLAIPAHHFTPLTLFWDKTLASDIWRRSWPIALSIVFNLLYLRTDILFLSLLKSQEDVGIYGAAYRVIDILTSFPMMFMGLAMAPIAMHWSNSSHDGFGRTVQRSFDFMVLSAFPLVVGTLFVAREVIVLVSGEAFAPAGPVLQILILACGGVFFGSFFGHLITVIHAQRTMLWRYALTAIVGVSGYALLIPRYSYWGAAWMTVASELLIVILAGVLFLQKSRVRLSLTSLSKTLLGCGGMAVFLAAFSWIHVIPRSLGAAVVYCGILILVGGIPKELFSRLKTTQF